MGGARRILILLAASLPLVLYLTHSSTEPATSTSRISSRPERRVVTAELDPAPPADGRRYPPGFTDTLVASVPTPTALAFTPDGRMLVAAQTGQLLVHAGGTRGNPPTRTALDLSPRACSWLEQGLLGVAVHPLFPANGYVYLFYTLDRTPRPPGEAGPPPGAAPGGGDCAHRVSRWTMHGDRIDPSSELVLLDNIPAPGGNHNGGYLHFGKDGYLYVSTGDGGCDHAGGGCAAANDASRDTHVLLGKILRITDTGGIPPGNPFTSPGSPAPPEDHEGAGALGARDNQAGVAGPASARCNLTGRTEPGLHCAETFAWGLRNPFRLAFDPDAPVTRFYVNDVGQDHWEEIDEGLPGADYGWNIREGHCTNGSATDCRPPASAAAAMTDPLFDYHHEAGCTAISGGAFVPGGTWPEPYDGAYLFADFMCGSIFRLVPTDTGRFRSEPFATGLGAGAGIDMTFGPSPSSGSGEAGRALYYTSYANGGEVRRIDFTGTVREQDRRPRP